MSNFPPSEDPSNTEPAADTPAPDEATTSDAVEPAVTGALDDFEPSEPPATDDPATEFATDTVEPAVSSAVDDPASELDVDLVTSAEFRDGVDYSEDELLHAASPADAFDDTTAPSGSDGYATDQNDPPPPYPPPPGTPPPPTGPPPGYGPAPGVRRIYRSRHDRKLGGVSAGIADFFRVDPTIVRVVTLLFAISGIGILVYLAAWFIIPLRPDGLIEPPRPAPLGNERTMTLAFGIAALALAFGIVTGSWAVLALALIGGGVWMLSEQTRTGPGLIQPSGAPSPPPTPGMYEPMAYSATQTMPPPPPVAPLGEAGPPPSGPAWQPATPTVRERKPQRITWIALSSLALLAAVGIAAATGDWWDVSATRFLGIGVIIIGVGVVVGQLRGGGARGLIPLGILAALFLFPVSAVDGLLDDGVGEQTYRPATIEQLADKYEHGIGQLVVDLSRLDFANRNETVDIDLGIGELIVIVSDDTGGQAVLQAKAGEVSHQMPATNSFLFEDGVNIETGTVRLAGDNGTLDLNISVGLGTAELRSRAN